MPSLPEHLMRVPVGRERLPREVMEAHQRERVLDAATAVFAKRGYPATTVEHLVAGARIGVGSFYSLFEGKQDCFLRAYDRVLADARERIAVAIPAAASWPQQVLLAFRTLLRFAAERPSQARLVLVEAPTAGPPARARYESAFEHASSVLRAGRSQTPLGAQLPASFEDATLSGVIWAVHQRLVSAEVEGIEGLFGELSKVLLEPHLGEAAAAEQIAAAAAT
jgi:AcrR family transcriptional regulator